MNNFSMNTHTMKPINLFYEETEADRWLPLDHYPRRILRRIIRGRPMIGGQRRVFLNLCAGLDSMGVSYRVNNYRYIKRHPGEVACVVGKAPVLDKIKWKNPILFGTAVFAHPSDDPNLLKRLPVRKVLVPGEWMRKMWEPYYGDKVIAWPVGIDAILWESAPPGNRDIDILLYDKVRWEHDRYEKELICPVLRRLEKYNLKVKIIRYGFYREENFHALLNRSKAMIFLCEHESQGIAYQQALSSGVPVMAWDRGGYWRDPAYFPHKVRFSPVCSVPYWDERCGVRFKDINEFSAGFKEFFDKAKSNLFAPRNYILENLTLEKCARRYLEILKGA